MTTRPDGRLSKTSSSFAVTQSLVGLLSRNGGSAAVKTDAKDLRGSSPETDTAGPGPLHLCNALAACVMSARLNGHHRQWAAQQLVQSLSTLRCTPGLSENQADLTGDLKACTTASLEAHGNRLTRCLYSEKKNLLASRFLYLYITVPIGHTKCISRSSTFLHGAC